MIRVRGRVAAVIAALLAATACAANGGLDVEALEVELRDQFATDALSSHAASLGNVTCPEPLSPEPGDRVICTMPISGDEARIEVVFTGARGGVMSAEIIDRLVDVDQVAAAVGQSFTGDLGLRSDVSCPAPLMVLADGQTIICEITDERDIVRAISVVPDTDGTISISFRNAP